MRSHNLEPVIAGNPGRELLGQLDVGREIQPELYQAVAEVLIYIYKMNQKKKSGAPAPKKPIRLAPVVTARK